MIWSTKDLFAEGQSKSGFRTLVHNAMMKSIRKRTMNRNSDGIRKSSNATDYAPEQSIEHAGVVGTAIDQTTCVNRVRQH